MGGGTVTFDGGCLRAPSEVFDYKDRFGYKIWPDEVNRQVLDPYYDKIEKMMQVRRMRWVDIPKTGGLFAKILEHSGLSCDRSNFNYSKKCRGCGFCETGGCKFGVKNTSITTYLKEATDNGAEIIIQANVETINRIEAEKVYKINYTDAQKNIQSVYAPNVFIAASALETPQLINRSKKYFSKISDQVGKNFSNNGDLSFHIQLSEPIDDYYCYKGTPNAGVITYAFWKDYHFSIHPGCIPPAIFAATEVHPSDDTNFKAWGLDYKKYIKKLFPHQIITAQVIGLFDGEGELKFRNNKMDIIFPKNERFVQYRDKVENTVKPVIEKYGAKFLYSNNRFKFEHGNAHHLGTMRMGDDAERSVCAPNGEVRGYPGLFISDGGVVPGGTGVNPALTIGANAERTVDLFINKKS